MKNSKITSFFKKVIPTFVEICPIKERPMHATFKDISSSHCCKYLFVNVSFIHHIQIVIFTFGISSPPYVPRVFPPIPRFIKLGFVICSLCCSHSSHASRFLYSLAPHHISSHISWWKVLLFGLQKWSKLNNINFILGVSKVLKTIFLWWAKSRRAITNQVDSKKNLYFW